MPNICKAESNGIYTFGIIYIKCETSNNFEIHLEITSLFFLSLSPICFLLFAPLSLVSSVFVFSIHYVSFSRTLKSVSRTVPPVFVRYVSNKGHYMQHDMLIKLLEMTSTSSEKGPS